MADFYNFVIRQLHILAQFPDLSHHLNLCQSSFKNQDNSKPLSLSFQVKNLIPEELMAWDC